MLIVTNLNLFVTSFRNLFDHSIQQIQDVNESNIYQSNDIASLLAKADEDSAEIQALLKQYQSGWLFSKSIANSEESLLRSKLRDYPFTFNTLPPVNKILISSLGLDVPIVEIVSKEAVDFVQGNYDEELTQGVVKYPTTPDP